MGRGVTGVWRGPGFEGPSRLPEALGVTMESLTLSQVTLDKAAQVSLRLHMGKIRRESGTHRVSQGLLVRKFCDHSAAVGVLDGP